MNTDLAQMGTAFLAVVVVEVIFTAGRALYRLKREEKLKAALKKGDKIYLVDGTASRGVQRAFFDAFISNQCETRAVVKIHWNSNLEQCVTMDEVFISFEAAAKAAKDRINE